MRQGVGASLWLRDIGALTTHGEDHFYVEHSSIGLAARSLIAIFFARFNRKMALVVRHGVNRRTAHMRLRRHMRNARQQIRNAERELYKMPYRDASVGAPRLAAVCARWIPRLADAQAAVTVALWDDLRGTKVGAVETGRLLLDAATLTRETLAAHAAAYRLYLDVPDVQGRETSALAALRDEQIPFSDGPVPERRVVDLKRIAKQREGTEVQVAGFVANLLVRRTSLGELIGVMRICDYRRRHAVVVVAKYAHFAHLGVTPASYVEIQGVFRRRSLLNGRNPAVEVDRAALADQSKRSWLVAFLQSAEDYYRWKPNGLEMRWTPGLQRRRGRVSSGGAGEVIWPPLVRGRGKKYGV
jgi:hypothetical protein